MKKSISAFLTTTGLFLASLQVQAEMVSYFDCDPTEPGNTYQATAFLPESDSQALVTLTNEDDPEFYLVVNADLKNEQQVLTYSAEGFLLSINFDRSQPTVTFSGRLEVESQGTVISTPLVCYLGSYEKPEEEMPGGISVHN